MISCDRFHKTSQSEFDVMSFGVNERSNLISVSIIWKEMIKEMCVFFASTPFCNLISFKDLMFVLKLLIEKGNTVFVQRYDME